MKIPLFESSSDSEVHLFSLLIQKNKCLKFVLTMIKALQFVHKIPASWKRHSCRTLLCIAEKTTQKYKVLRKVGCPLTKVLQIVAMNDSICLLLFDFKMKIENYWSASAVWGQ